MKLLEPWQGPQSRLDKLKASLVARLPASWPLTRREQFLTQVGSVVTAAWSAAVPDKKAITDSAVPQ